MNGYAHCGNNPTSQVDPTGLKAMKIPKSHYPRYMVCRLETLTEKHFDKQFSSLEKILLEENRNYIASNSRSIPIGDRYDSSTGNAQIFASTAIKAINYVITNDITTREELEIPSDLVISNKPNLQKDTESYLYIWQRLNSD